MLRHIILLATLPFFLFPAPSKATGRCAAVSRQASHTLGYSQRASSNQEILRLLKTVADENPRLAKLFHSVERSFERSGEGVYLSKDKKRIMIDENFFDGKSRVFHVEGGRIQEFSNPQNFGFTTNRRTRFSDDGQLAVRDSGREVLIWNSDGEVVARIPLEDNQKSLGFLPGSSDDILVLQREIPHDPFAQFSDNHWGLGFDALDNPVARAQFTHSPPRPRVMSIQQRLDGASLLQDFGEGHLSQRNNRRADIEFQRTLDIQASNISSSHRPNTQILRFHLEDIESGNDRVIDPKDSLVSVYGPFYSRYFGQGARIFDTDRGFIFEDGDGQVIFR